MKMFCCGVCYNTADIETYWRISKFKLKKPTREKIGDSKVVKEFAYVLECKEGCTKVNIVRQIQLFDGKNTRFKTVDKKELSGKTAYKYLQETENIRVLMPSKPPIKPIKYRKTIPFVYGKTIDGFTQRGRYISEEDWATDKIFESKIIFSSKT